MIALLSEIMVNLVLYSVDHNLRVTLPRNEILTVRTKFHGVYPSNIMVRYRILKGGQISSTPNFFPVPDSRE